MNELSSAGEGGRSVGAIKGRLTERAFSAPRRPPRSPQASGRVPPGSLPNYSADNQVSRDYLSGKGAPDQGMEPPTPRAKQTSATATTGWRLRLRSPPAGCSAPARTGAPAPPALATRQERPRSRESRRGSRPARSTEAPALRSAGTPARRCRRPAAQIGPRPVATARRRRRLAGRRGACASGHRCLPHRRSATGDDPFAPHRIRREHAVVEHQVDARPRDERGQLLEQLQRSNTSWQVPSAHAVFSVSTMRRTGTRGSTSCRRSTERLER